MWIERIDVRGFRRLRREVELHPGLNFVYGENEAGKSSLFDAMVCCLFGFPGGERRGDGSKRAHSRPWIGDEHGLQAVIRDAVGRERIRLEWDFAAHQVRVMDEDTGQDLSAEVGKTSGDVDLGSWLLGIEKPEFVDVCCLEQKSITPVEGTENLKQALQKSLASNAAGVGQETAEETLKDFLRNEIGLDLRGMNPKGDGRLGTLESKLGRARELLVETEQARKAIAESASELPALANQEATIAAEERKLHQRLLLTRSEAIATRLGKAREKKAAAADRPEARPRLPQDEIDAVGRDRGRLSDLDEELKTLATKASGNAPEVERLGVEIDRLTIARDELAPYEGVDPDAESEVRALLGDDRRAGERIAEFDGRRVRVEGPDPQLAKYRQDRDRLISSRSEGTFATGPVLAAALVALASIAVGLLASPAAFAGLIVAAVILLVGNQAAGEAGPSEDQLRSDYGSPTIEELDQRVREEDQARSSVEAETALLERQAREAVDERERINGELVRLGRKAYPQASPRSSVERGEAYLAAVTKYRERTDVVAKLTEAQLGLKDAAAPARDLNEKRARREGLVQSLRGTYARLGIDADDLEVASERLKERLREQEVLRERARAAAAADEALSGLLEGRSIDELAERGAEVSQELEDHRARHGNLAEQDGDESGLQRQLDSARQRLAQVRTDRTALEREVAQRDKDLEDPAELKAQIADIEPQIEALEEAQAAIEVALEDLGQAASDTYRESAPALREALQRNLPKITGNRYAEAQVSEDLEIQVRAPETGQMVHTDRLSRGTRDQIFLVERLEIAAMLDRTNSRAPMLLDDPFDRFDLKRLEFALEILGDVARDRQVVFFSEDDHVVEAVKRVCSECNMVELPAPTERAV